MPFVSARIPTSFTCTSTCKSSGQHKFCSMGARKDPGAFVFQKPAARARRHSKVGKNSGGSFLPQDTENTEEGSGKNKVRILRALCASVVNMISPCTTSPSASSPPRNWSEFAFFSCYEAGLAPVLFT
jgi:hypothetical protein